MNTTHTLRAAPRPFAELGAWHAAYREDILEPALPIIDPHHHAWLDGRGRYVFDELSADVNSGHNVLATVFVQSGENMYRADGPAEMKSVGEVEFVNGIAAMAASGRIGKARLCAGIVGYADLALGDAVQPVLDALIAAGNGRLRGIRHNMAWDESPATADHSSVNKHNPRSRQLCLNADFQKGVARLAKCGLSFDAWMFFPQLPELMDLLRKNSETSVILNHVGGILGVGPYRGKRDEIFATWKAHMRELAAFPNLKIKVGGFGMPRCGWDFHLRDTHATSEELAAAWKPYVETTIEIFGPARCMLESNFPVDKFSCGYAVLWNAFKRLTKNYSAADKAALYKNTAAEAYRLHNVPGVSAA
jgi:predicted TIM-barrel fold metal-dependent hydrolase